MTSEQEELENIRRSQFLDTPTWRLRRAQSKIDQLQAENERLRTERADLTRVMTDLCVERDALRSGIANVVLQSRVAELERDAKRYIEARRIMHAEIWERFMMYPDDHGVSDRVRVMQELAGALSAPDELAEAREIIATLLEFGEPNEYPATYGEARDFLKRTEPK